MNEKALNAEDCLAEWAKDFFGSKISWKEQKKYNKEYFGKDWDIYNDEMYSFAKFMIKKIRQARKQAGNQSEAGGKA